MKDKLKDAVKEAMKAKDKVRLDALRQLLTAIQYEEMEKKVEPLPEEGCVNVLQRELKKRREEVEFAEKANRADLKEKLGIEITLIESFLPKQLPLAEIEKALIEFKQQNPGLNMGGAMKLLKERFAGQYDSKSASEAAKRIFA